MLTRTILGVTACVVVALAAVPAQARNEPGSRALLNIKRDVRAFWASKGQRPNCRHVTVRYAWLPPGIGGLAGGTAMPCLVHMNTRRNWLRVADPFAIVAEYPSVIDDPHYGYFCWTLMHEYGHLRGMPWDGFHGRAHSSNPRSVMYPDDSRAMRQGWWPRHPACR